MPVAQVVPDSVPGNPTKKLPDIQRGDPHFALSRVGEIADERGLAASGIKEPEIKGITGAASGASEGGHEPE